MKITALTIGGFKGIKEKATIPLSPITLFFGANSTGKSTVLHALLYLYEVIYKRNFDAQHSSIAGESLYFGGFHNLVHGKQHSGTITLGATLDFRDDASSIWDDYLSESEYWLVESYLGFTPESTADVFSFEIDLQWDSYLERVFVSRFECSSQGISYIKFSAQPGKPDSAISYYTPLSNWEVDEAFIVENLFESGVWETIPVSGRDALPVIEKRLDLTQVPFDWANVVPEQPLAGKLFAEAALSQCALAPLKLFVKKLQGLLHIGPLRVVPVCSSIVSKHIDSKRWYDGSAGWDEFGNGNEHFQHRVNNYLNNNQLLNCGYLFKVETIGAPPQQEKRVVLLQDASSPPLLPAQVGVGVSQVFPFVVAACLPRSAIVSCEQPELHIHPRWQFVLGDMMLHACHQDTEQMFLVETHSEHLMLRLLKRRRQTAESELTPEDNFSCLKEDIQIVFCEQTSGKTRLLPIKTTDEGHFDAPWPNGFFTERREELF